MTFTPVTPLSERTLGDLVAEEGARARVLERHGIDYCCHGDRSLADACTAAGLDTVEVAAELVAVQPTGGVQVAGSGPLALAEHIVSSHHAYLDEELPALEALALKVRGVHGGRHPELGRLADLVVALHAELVPHLRHEERVVFPAFARVVLGGDGDDVGAEVDALVEEHERAGAVLHELRSVTSGYTVPDDACTSYRSLYERLEALEQDTFEHIHLENNVLFPAVRRRLP